MGGIMIKILICEDIERDKLHLHQLLDSFLQSNKISYKIDYLENFDVGSNLFLEYDLIFLDIEKFLFSKIIFLFLIAEE